MAMPPVPFRYEVEMRGDETTVRCHGRLVAETADELKDLVKPLIPKSSTIVLDLTDVTYVDSSGLGTLLGLKVSAALSAYSSLEFINLSPRVQELLRITKLTSLFKSRSGESRQPTAAAEREEKPESSSIVVSETAENEMESDVITTLGGPVADEDYEAQSSSMGAEKTGQEKIEREVAMESSAPVAAVSRKSAPRKKAAKILPKKTPKEAVKKPVKKPIEKAAKKKMAKSVPPSRRSTDR